MSAIVQRTIPVSYSAVSVADESMQKCFAEGSGPVYRDVISWLQSSNTQLQLSGALAIANFARNGKTAVISRTLTVTVRHYVPSIYLHLHLEDVKQDRLPAAGCGPARAAALRVGLTSASAFVSDSNCVKMLDLGVVPHILSMLEQHVDEGDVSVQHAGLSALRNLAIPGRGQDGAAPSARMTGPCFGRTWRHQGWSSHASVFQPPTKCGCWTTG